MVPRLPAVEMPSEPFARKGFGYELFTSADTYILQLSSDVDAVGLVRQPIMGAVMCVDLVLKE